MQTDTHYTSTANFPRQVLLAAGVLLFSVFFYPVSVGASETYCKVGAGCCKDGLICPDGTVLGRQLPLCDFPECPGSGGGGITADCGPAAKNYAYTDTAYSGLLCRAGSSPTVGNGSVPFPAPGSTVSWRCFNGSSPTVDCSASRDSAPITCGTADGRTYSTPTPPSNLLCSDGSVPPVSYRLSGGYKIGWSWTCGSSSCSANLSPGVCGSANRTTRATAPSTVAELCSTGLASAVSGSGPWTWSCTGTACSASKAVSVCTPNCSAAPLVCSGTTFSDGCGGVCWGTMSCTTPRLKVCPASVTLNPTQIQPLEARYWANYAGIPSCSTAGYSPVTNSATWSPTVGTIATVSNAAGSKGVVTAGSPASTQLVNIQASYGVLPSSSAVTVNVAGGPPPSTFTCLPNVSLDLSNAVPCVGDTVGLMANRQNSLVDSCSPPPPVGSEPKCEYVCKSGWIRNGTSCVGSVPPCVCDDTENATQCIGTTYVNSCGRSCDGTKECDGHFIEVAP